MSKILRIHAKKGSTQNTSANEDFMTNLQRASQSSVPDYDSSAFTTGFETLEETVEEPVEETGPKPFSDPIPREPQSDEIPPTPADFDEPIPEESEPVQFDIPFEQPAVVEEIPEKTATPIVQTKYVQPAETEKKFREISVKMLSMETRIQSILERITHMALNLEALTEEVTRAKTVQASATTLIKKVVDELETLSAELAARISEPTIDTSAIDALVNDLKESTDTLAGAVADSVDVKPTHKIVLNSNNPEKATIEVVLPEVLPEVVEATVEPLNPDGIDIASADPQARVVVDEASDVAGKNTTVLETAEGEANVTVAVDPASPVLEVAETVKEAYDATPEVTAVPAQ